MVRTLSWIWVLVMVFGLAAGPAIAVNLVFSEPDFQWVQTGGPATPYHIWAIDDYWAQTFPGTALDQASEMDLRLFIDDNILTAGDYVDLDVLLNGTKVGDLTIPSGLTGACDYSFAFSDILGPTYAVKLLETNTVPSGHGSVSMLPDGRSYLTLVPEPATLCLLVLGGLAAIKRKRL